MFTLEMLKARLDELVEWEPRLSYEASVGKGGRLEVCIQDDGDFIANAYYIGDNILDDITACNKLMTVRIAEDVRLYREHLDRD